MKIRKFITAVKINNQKGFATIEIIFILLIISVLVGEVIPKFSRSLDIAELNCETQKFISRFYFAKSVNRTAYYSGNSFFNLKLNSAYPVQMNVSEKFYELKRNTTRIGDRNYLPPGMTVHLQSKNPQFLFNDEEDYYRGSSETVILKSRSGRQSELIIDSVGRIRKKS